MLQTGIYKIQSKIKPERIYIGSAVRIDNRWSGHLRTLRKNAHNKKIQNHYNKYGEQDFEFSIICLCSKEDLIKNEQKYINLFNPYFNICKIAGSTLGVQAWNKGKKCECTSGEKNGMFGKHHTIEARKIMSDAAILEIISGKGKKGKCYPKQQKSAA